MRRAIVTGLAAFVLLAGTARADSAPPAATGPGHTASYPYDGPSPAHVDRSTFGILESTGDAVLDCGEMADHSDDLPPAALQILERCLDVHGWTYDQD